MCYVYDLDGEILDMINTNKEAVWWIISKTTHEENNK
jgi:hypothetical protein